MNRVVQDILKPINTAAILIMGVYTMLWGAWLVSPWWHVFTRAAIYHYMQIFPEWCWGLLAMSVGLAMIYGVIRKSFRSLTTGAFIGFAHWITVSAFIFFGDWQNTGGITYLMISVYCAFIWLNLTVNRDIFGKLD